MGRTTWAWGLVAYGVLGLILVAAGIVFGLAIAERIERLASASAGTLDAAARSTRAAATSFTSVDASLESAETSADQAASLAEDAGQTLDALALAMDLSIFGSRPLQPLAAEFETSADQARQLAGTLAEMGGSLAGTRDDATSIGVELEGLATQLEALRAATPTDPIPVRALVALLLAWLALPSIGALVAGATLLRADRRAARSA